MNTATHTHTGAENMDDAQYLRLIAAMSGTTSTGEALANLDRITKPARCSKCRARAPLADVGTECASCGGSIENES